MFALIHVGDWFFVSWHRQKQPSSLICTGIFQGSFTSLWLPMVSVRLCKKLPPALRPHPKADILTSPAFQNLPSTRIYMFKKSRHKKIKQISQQLPLVPPYVSTTWPFQRSYLHEQDALRQQLGVKALQRKMRMDLDQQARVLSY